MYKKHLYRNRKTSIKHNKRIKQADMDRNIVVKESTIYKPLITVFFAFFFIFIVVFPISIFDQIAPTIMMFFRRLVELSVYSAIATLLTLPVSLLDAKLISVFGQPNMYSDFYAIFVLIYAVAMDTLFALIGYRFARNLSRLFIKKEKKQKDKVTMNNLLDKYGSVAMFLAAATPLPFTVAVYYAGAIKFHLKKFLIFTALGRLFKYGAYAFFLRVFGLDIVEVGVQI